MGPRSWIDARYRAVAGSGTVEGVRIWNYLKEAGDNRDPTYPCTQKEMADPCPTGNLHSFAFALANEDERYIWPM